MPRFSSFIDAKPMLASLDIYVSEPDGWQTIEKPPREGAITRQGARPWDRIIGLQDHKELFNSHGISE